MQAKKSIAQVQSNDIFATAFKNYKQMNKHLFKIKNQNWQLQYFEGIWEIPLVVNSKLVIQVQTSI